MEKIKYIFPFYCEEDTKMLKHIFKELNRILPYEYIIYIKKIVNSAEYICIGNWYYISESYFMNLNMLTEVLLPNSVKIIDDYAFYNCRHLSYIKLSDQTVSIGNFAFYNCMSIQMFNFDSKNLKYIGESAFSNCKNLTIFNVQNPDAVIEDKAFAFCSSLKKIILHPRLTKIKNDVFIGCYFLNENTNTINKDALGSIGLRFLSYMKRKN